MGVHLGAGSPGTKDQSLRRGTAVLLVSSEIEEVLGLADQVLVIADGRVVHAGPAAEIDEHGVLDLVMEGAPS